MNLNTLKIFIIFTFTFGLFFSNFEPNQARGQTPPGCTDGWKTTGYHIPVEADFFGSNQSYQLWNFDNTVLIETRQGKSDFLGSVSIN